MVIDLLSILERYTKRTCENGSGRMIDWSLTCSRFRDFRNIGKAIDEKYWKICMINWHGHKQEIAKQFWTNSCTMTFIWWMKRFVAWNIWWIENKSCGIDCKNGNRACMKSGFTIMTKTKRSGWKKTTIHRTWRTCLWILLTDELKNSLNWWKLFRQVKCFDWCGLTWIKTWLFRNTISTIAPELSLRDSSGDWIKFVFNY